jgi:hypothetical protein
MTGGAQAYNPFQPPWKQTGKEAGTKDAILYRTEKGEQAGQNVVAVTDEGVEVSVPHVPYINMLDPSGHVCPMLISTNRDLMQADQKFRHVSMTIRQRKGWVIWDYDPMVHMGMTAQEWDTKRQAERERRKAKAAKQSARFNAMTNDKMAELLGACADNQKLLSRVVAKLEAGDLAGAEKLAAKGAKDGPGGKQ